MMPNINAHSRSEIRNDLVGGPGAALRFANRVDRRRPGALFIYSVIAAWRGDGVDSLQEAPENKCFPESALLSTRGNVLKRLHDFTTRPPQGGLQAFLCGSYAIAQGKVVRGGQNPTPIAGQAWGALVPLTRLR